MRPGRFALGTSIYQSSPSSTCRPRLPEMKSPSSPSGRGASGWDQGRLGTRASLLCEAAREARGSRLHTSRCGQLSHVTHLWGKELRKPRPGSEPNSSAVREEKPEGALPYQGGWGWRRARRCALGLSGFRNPYAGAPVKCCSMTLHLCQKCEPSARHTLGKHESSSPPGGWGSWSCWQEKEQPRGTRLSVALGPGSRTCSTVYPASLGQRRLPINVLFLCACFSWQSHFGL